MVICESYMLKFSVIKDMKKQINNDKRRRDMVVGKVVAFMSNTNYMKKKIKNDKRRRDMIMSVDV